MRNMRASLLFSLVAALVIAYGACDYPDEREALMEFYVATNGDSWWGNDGWNTTNDVCSWYGITCGAGGHVNAIELNSNNVFGDVGGLGTLTALGELHTLSITNTGYLGLTGTMPVSILYINELRSLDLSYNSISGNFPIYDGYLPKLRELKLQHNQFYSVNFGTVSFNLTYLDLSYNQLINQGSMSFLQFISQFPNLRYVDASHNKFQEPLGVFRSFERLHYLSLAYNEFYVNDTLDFSPMENLQVLDLSYNVLATFLSGMSWDNFPVLRRALLQGNRFYGGLPYVLLNIASIEKVDLSMNEFNDYGSLPDQPFSSSLTSLNVGSNPDLMLYVPLSFMTTLPSGMTMWNVTQSKLYMSKDTAEYLLAADAFESYSLSTDGMQCRPCCTDYSSAVPENLEIVADGYFYYYANCKCGSFSFGSVPNCYSLWYIVAPSVAFVLIMVAASVAGVRSGRRRHYAEMCKLLTRFHPYFKDDRNSECPQHTARVCESGVSQFLGDRDVRPSGLESPVPFIVPDASDAINSAPPSAPASPIASPRGGYGTFGASAGAEHQPVSPDHGHNEQRPLLQNVRQSHASDYVAPVFIHKKVSLIQRVGDGPRGSVHVTVHNTDPTAVKVYRSPVWDNGMLQNISKLFGLEHPGLLELRGIRRTPAMLLTEYCARGSIREILCSSSLSRELKSIPFRLHAIMLEAARAVNYLHNRPTPVVHGSLKSSNIMLKSTWICKVSDYGLYTTSSNIPVQNIAWVAPELLMAAHEPLTPESDVYSFGIVMYEVFSGGRHPYPSEWNANRIREFVLNGGRPDVESCAPRYRHLIARCLNADLSARPTFADIVQELETMGLDFQPEADDFDATASDNATSETGDAAGETVIAIGGSAATSPSPPVPAVAIGGQNGPRQAPELQMSATLTNGAQCSSDPTAAPLSESDSRNSMASSGAAAERAALTAPNNSDALIVRPFEDESVPDPSWWQRNGLTGAAIIFSLVAAVIVVSLISWN